jgi:protein SCO1/2
VLTCRRRAALAAIVATLAGAVSRGDEIFRLTDHHGRPFALSAIDGQAALVYFGYTMCADACPVALSKMTQVVNRLAKDGRRLVPIFVTIDPERDTVEILRTHLAAFSTPVVGLTGTRAEIDRVASAYGVRYEIEKSDSAAGYHVNHTLDLYLIARGGGVLRTFRHTESARSIYDEIVKSNAVR